MHIFFWSMTVRRICWRWNMCWMNWQEIIKIIIAMARNLGMDTVAEGVETSDQHVFLTNQGCHIMQGYYFGKPMSAEQFEKLLHMGNSG